MDFKTRSTYASHSKSYKQKKAESTLVMHCLQCVFGQRQKHAIEIIGRLPYHAYEMCLLFGCGVVWAGQVSLTQVHEGGYVSSTAAVRETCAYRQFRLLTKCLKKQTHIVTAVQL